MPMQQFSWYNVREAIRDGGFIASVGKGRPLITDMCKFLNVIILTSSLKYKTYAVQSMYRSLKRRLVTV